MLCIAIKYLFICFCCLTFFTKLLNISASKKQQLLNILFSVFFAASSVVIRTYFLDSSILLLYSLVFIYTYFVYSKGFNITTTSSIIAYSLSFFMFLISLFVTAAIGHKFAPKHESFIFDITTNLIVGSLEIVFTTLIFKIKRLKNGMPFLLRYGSSNIGVFVSVALILTFVLNSNIVETKLQKILVIVSLVFGIITMIWWRKKLYSDYLKKIKENDINELRKTIQLQEETIASLTTANEELAKIIHKDNKLIPAMQAAVIDLINRNKTNDAEKLLSQLNSLYGERTEAINLCEVHGDALTKTEVLSTDGLIKYLYIRANDLNTKFDVTITSSVKYLIENIVSEQDLNTLIADLAENAIIATKNEQNRYILLSIGLNSNNHYQIDIYDSAPPFADIVLQNIGENKTTTHAEEGGSGIGLVTTFEILNKYKASFKINQDLNSTTYAKCVSVIFDMQNSVTLPALSLHNST